VHQLHLTVILHSQYDCGLTAIVNATATLSPSLNYMMRILKKKLEFSVIFMGEIVIFNNQNNVQ
jgi:hypothetical protein